MKIEDFRSYLERRNLSKRVISDYISRCKRVAKFQNINLDSDEILIYIDSDDEFDKIIIEGDRKKGVSSLKSALRSYYMFSKGVEPVSDQSLSESLINNAQSQTDEIIVDQTSKYYSEITYKKQEIIRRFLSRLKTQDRLYRELGILYWPRLFVKYYTWYIDLLRDEIENKIECTIRKNNAYVQVSLSNIKGIRFFSAGEVYEINIILDDNTEFPLISINELLTVNLMDDPLSKVTLDHVTPFYNIVESLNTQLPQLNKLFRAYTDLIPDENLLRSSVRNIEIQESIFNNNIVDEEELKTEVELIHSKVKLQLMHFSDNSRRGRN